jgi:D-beta-D-heptose 7-phosphate kinase/D-beta-D-heptose 1-phosphate adenosyltransferase
MIENKIKDTSTLKTIVSSLKKRGKKIVFTNGCFDILHKGHIKLLKIAKSLGDVLIVAINSDNSVKKIKGPKKPINTAKDRAFVLSAIDFVDFITTFSQPTPAQIIKKLNPDVLVKGGDWKKEEIVGKDFIESKGGKVYTISLARGYSTSHLIKTIVKRFK